MVGQETRIRPWQWRLISIALFIIAWQLAVDSGALAEYVLSSPWMIIEWTTEWHLSGDGIRALGVTVVEAGAGYIIGIVAGALVAAAFLWSRFLSDVFNPYMAVLGGLPLLVIAPFFIYALGFGMASKIASAAVLVFSLAFFNLYGGLRAIDPLYIQNVKLMGANAIRLAIDVYVPATAVWAMSTLRIGLGLALVGAIAGEFAGALDGVGLTMARARGVGATEAVMGAILTVAVVAALLDSSLSRIERKYAAWTIF
ncbi:MAG TPA: ABC transporter permease subunit [Acidimicrobiia bacterium]|nr:ABC transporter permease subunit [Acidimicrobiia bacterium]